MSEETELGDISIKTCRHSTQSLAPLLQQATRDTAIAQGYFVVDPTTDPETMGIVQMGADKILVVMPSDKITLVLGTNAPTQNTGRQFVPPLPNGPMPFSGPA